MYSVYHNSGSVMAASLGDFATRAGDVEIRPVEEE
jgi:hypothetical protein